MRRLVVAMSAGEGEAGVLLDRSERQSLTLSGMSGFGLLLCKLSPEPHFAGRKSLM
jgi:hypothetical protein